LNIAVSLESQSRFRVLPTRGLDNLRRQNPQVFRSAKPSVSRSPASRRIFLRRRVAALSNNPRRSSADLRNCVSASQITLSTARIHGSELEFKHNKAGVSALTPDLPDRLELCGCWRRPVSSELPPQRLSTLRSSLLRSPVAGFPTTKTLASDRPFARPPRSVFYAARHEVNVPGLALLRTVESAPPPALP
jgi:hypothetical protein